MTVQERALILLLQDTLYEPLTPALALDVRAALGLSQQELSLRLGMAGNAFNRYERGTRIARSATLLRLAIIGAIVCGSFGNAPEA